MEHQTRITLLPLALVLVLVLSPAAAQTPAAAATPAPAAALPAAAAADVIRVLQKAGQFTTLIKLMKGTQVSDQINSQLSGSSSQGITVFAPTDNAFAGLKTGTLNSLTSEQQLRLVQYHVLPAFYALSQFETVSNPLHTQAGNSDNGQYPLNVTTTTGNQVNITTGVVNATISNTVYTDGQLAIFQVDKVLLPLDIFGTSTAKAPAPAPVADEKPAKSKDVGDGKDDDSAPVAATDNDDSAAAGIVGGRSAVGVVVGFGVAFLAVF